MSREWDAKREGHNFAPNLRCNSCGKSPAAWTWDYPNARPGFGCLALCESCRDEWDYAHASFRETVERLRKVNYEAAFTATAAQPAEGEAK